MITHYVKATDNLVAVCKLIIVTLLVVGGVIMSGAIIVIVAMALAHAPRTHACTQQEAQWTTEK